MNSASTDDAVSMTVCDSQHCCTAVLNNAGDDRKKGHVDMYADPAILGTCLTTRMRGQLTATLTKEKSDGWYVDWAQIRLARGYSFTCMFNNWLDDNSGYTTSMTVSCNEGSQ